MRTDYDTIYLGCSAFAIGAAQRDPENALIIERGEGVAGEFVDALMTTGFSRPRTTEAQALYDALIRRNAMSAESAARGEIHLPGVGLMLAAVIREKRLNVLMKTRVIAISAQDGACRIRAVCNARLYDFTCRRLVDTRSDDYARLKALDPAAQVCLCANVSAPGAPDADWPGMRLKKGFLPQEYYLQMNLDAPSAGDRLRFLNRYDSRPAAYMPLRLLMLCHAYGVASKPIREERGQMIYIPSCGFGNPLDAYDAGIMEGRQRNG